MLDKILIIDFGSQYTQLIARRVRELNVYCEIHPFNKSNEVALDSFIGVILSGIPCSVLDEEAPDVALEVFGNLPLLGVCYGAQLLAKKMGGKVAKSAHREYGRANLNQVKDVTDLLSQVNVGSTVRMSHGDTIVELPEVFEQIASTENIPVAAFKWKDRPVYGIQFHPEVTHSEQGKQLIENFIVKICGASQSWTPDLFAESTIAKLKEKIGNDKVVMGLSGGVDSSVAAVLIDKAIGENLYCIFVDNGLLRKNEFEEVLTSYKGLGLNVEGVDAKSLFYDALEGLEEPEAKRKAIGRVFIDVFEQEAKKIKNVKWLGQGTIYPDVIESVSVNGTSVTIKSHHNVGGLPEKMNLKVLEPLNTLFKDEVRKVGATLDISK